MAIRSRQPKRMIAAVTSAPNSHHRSAGTPPLFGCGMVGGMATTISSHRDAGFVCHWLCQCLDLETHRKRENVEHISNDLLFSKASTRRKVRKFLASELAAIVLNKRSTKYGWIITSKPLSFANESVVSTEG